MLPARKPADSVPGGTSIRGGIQPPASRSVLDRDAYRTTPFSERTKAHGASITIAFTDDVRIYSRNGDSPSDGFDGYCFRFAEVSEIEYILRSTGVDAATSGAVAQTVPRYLVPRPLEDHPDEIAGYARRGYATVIAAPLRTPEAVALASRQVDALADLDVPLLLFLDRIAEIRIDVERPNQKPYRRRLSRRQTAVGDVPLLPGTRMYEVDVGEGRRFLVVRREVDKQRVLDAV